MSRHHTPSRIRTTSALVLSGGLLVLGLAACAGPEATPEAVPGRADGPVDATVVMQDNSFNPEDVVVPAGQAVIEVDNTGDRQHNFVIDDGDVSSGTVDPGDQVTLTLDVPDGGATFRCTFHGNMTGRLVTG